MWLFSIITATTLILNNNIFVVTTDAAAVIESSSITTTPPDDDMKIVFGRRISNIQSVAFTSADNINAWKNTLQSSGTWSSIDMTTGCGARVANWPAIEHLSRARSLASAYISNPNDPTLLDKSIQALDYWFNNDFIPLDCVDNGGVASKKCPCGTPGLWSKNWFNQVIQVPKLVGDTCLLLKKNLTASQHNSCINIQTRAFDKVNNNSKLGGIRTMTGVNLLDVASIGVSLGLLNDDPGLLQIALNSFYGGVFINSKVAGDGIQSDGSFMQHSGLLYNGNYGKDYINDVLSIFTETKGTSLTPSTDVQNAFETLMSGTEWMIIADTKLNKLMWQYSTIGRMNSFKYEDAQSSGGVAIDINKVSQGSEGWSTEKDLDQITDRLQASHTVDANQGHLVGTRYFYNADYMVHRAPTYVSTMKMYSSRTFNSECVNAQNPYGFHFSDGAFYNYLTGDEYVDVFGAWNWELVPGTTVDIGGTPLKCKTVKYKGVKSFVGGATDGNTGIAVMDFQNPRNGNLSFKKTAFFFPSGYAVQVGPVTSKNTKAQLVTVLDQRKRNGDIYVAGKIKNTNTNYTTPESKSIWHDKIGYYFPTSEILYVDSIPKASNWSNIGISVGNETQQLWTSYIKHDKTSTTGLLTQYIVQPNIAQTTFQNNINKGKIPISLASKSSKPQVNAAYSAADATMAVAFWSAGTYATPWKSTTVTSDQPCVLLLRQIDAKKYRVIVADPSQSLTSVEVTVEIGSMTRSTTVDLPTGSESGKGVVETLTF